jgi:similar to stage IV sporulation protein
MIKLEHIVYGRVQILVKGLNLDRVFKLLKTRKIELKRIQKLSHKELTFFILAKELKQVTAVLNEYNYDVLVKARYGYPFFLHFLSHRVGLLVGGALFTILTLFLSTFVWNVEVYGLETLQKNEIINTMRESGVAVGQQVTLQQVEQIENALQNTYQQISMISVMKKGTTIFVNLKEERIPAVMVQKDNSQPLVAQFEGVITKLNVVQGTPVVKVGDTVKAGDTLVEAYFTNLSGRTIKCTPIADVVAKVWFSETVQFDTKKIEWIETGNWVEKSVLSLGKQQFIVRNHEPEYENYKVKTSSKFLFSNNFIPLKINKIKYCELTSIVIEQNFDENKEKLEQTALILAKEKLPSNITPQKEFTTIQKNGTMYLVSAYLECELTIQTLT